MRGTLSSRPPPVICARPLMAGPWRSRAASTCLT
ncbi:Uncharacterised protein [Bordetella pertussis]|nr:Uncharacterised protein [Bordetella pertussis]